MSIPSNIASNPVAGPPASRPASIPDLAVTPLEEGQALVQLPTPALAWSAPDLSARLFRAQRMDTLGGLAGAVTHEFNNLLLAIRGNIGLVLSDPHSSEFARTRLKHADIAAERAGVLCQQLQAFARLPDEKPQRVDLNDAIKTATSLARRILRGRIMFELNLCLESTLVILDPRQLEQLVINVCLNAAEAMPAGSNISVISSAASLTSGDAGTALPAVQFTVSDRGPGISADCRPQVFEPFYSTKPPGRAVGLGLTVAQSVVERAGGSITVLNAPGGGTRVEVRLPMARGAEA